MNADINGALNNINRSYRVFEHNGKPMTKNAVKKILTYGLLKGYTHTGQISSEEIDKILSA